MDNIFFSPEVIDPFFDMLAELKRAISSSIFILGATTRV